MANIFPATADLSNGSDNMAIQLFGNRIFSDQSLYEYLIEFLLVFISPKGVDKELDTMAFHSNINTDLVYYVKPRMGLKRFIFYNRSKKDIKISVDEKAFNSIFHIMQKSIEDRGIEAHKAESTIEAIQDLLYGYAAVLKNRSWTAQSLLPIAPELIFCEAMLNKKARIALSRNPAASDTDIEMLFDFSRHNFMARGGEVFYLHILQALQACQPTDKILLESLLKHLITANGEDFSKLANWIYDSWLKNQNIDPEKLWIKKQIGFIPATGYIDCGQNTISELINFLSNDMHPITRIELLSKGIILQIMRMMCHRTIEYLGVSPSPWIVDLRSKKAGNTVMKISAGSYRKIEELFVNAINKMTSIYLDQNEGASKLLSPFEYLAKSKTHTLNMFKRLGKEMQCIIPLRGGQERFSLSEDLVKFIVLSIIKPQGKMTFDMFLDEVYSHFNIVIGAKQYKKCVSETKLGAEQANSFSSNEKEFQDFLKNTGFLRDLSDATSIVVNPYSEVILQ